MAKKKINDIYADYFQKSKVFLYPALGIKRGTSVTPMETYLSWGDDIRITDNKLVCVFHVRDDSEFIGYEEKYLLGNPLFEDYLEIEGDKAVYIFNFDSYAEDFKHVVNAEYSKISQELKDKIRDMYGVGSANYTYIRSYLYHEEDWDVYADILCIDPADNPKMVALLKEVGELCSKPNLEKEQLKISAKSLKL